MIISIGTDLEDTSRFKKYCDFLKKDPLEKTTKEENFLKRIFFKKELKYCSEQAFPEIHLAARFSAKEATYKAITQAMALNFEPRKLLLFKAKFFINSIEITKTNQIPQIKLATELDFFLNSLIKKNQIYRFFLSLSHTKSQVISQVLFRIS